VGDRGLAREEKDGGRFGLGEERKRDFFLLCFICFKEFARYFKREFGEGIFKGKFQNSLGEEFK
jgi:hypothetical protein